MVRRDLLTGGYDEKDCLLASSAEVAEGAKRNLEDHAGFLARLGSSRVRFDFAHRYQRFAIQAVQ